jgi:hypothetical protein
MSILNWMIDLDQESKLQEQAQTIEQLNEKCDILYSWVNYLNAELQGLKNGECQARQLNKESTVVASSERLETSILEDRATSTEARY